MTMKNHSKSLSYLTVNYNICHLVNKCVFKFIGYLFYTSLAPVHWFIIIYIFGLGFFLLTLVWPFELYSGTSINCLEMVVWRRVKRINCIVNYVPRCISSLFQIPTFWPALQSVLQWSDLPLPNLHKYVFTPVHTLPVHTLLPVCP